MASQILDIYDAIEGMSVTVSATADPDVVLAGSRVYGLDAIPQSVASTNLPCRIISPMSALNDDVRQTTFVALGSTAQIEWTILDLLLWRPILQGEGMYTLAPSLVEYVGAYMQAAKPLRGLSSQSQWTSITAQIGVFPYPLDARPETVAYYAGVSCVWTIKEALFGV